jgi:hypothetical protein
MIDEEREEDQPEEQDRIFFWTIQVMSYLCTMLTSVPLRLACPG